MPLKKETSIIGILGVGTWTAMNGAEPTSVYDPANVYTHESAGKPASNGARITPSVSKVKQRAGDSGGVRDSSVTEHDMRLEIKLMSAVLANIRMFLGLPATAHTGDLSAGVPTSEAMVVRGGELATEEFQFYVKTRGPLGPRYYYFPRCTVESLMALELNKNSHLEPGAGFDVLENEAGEYWWVIDAAA